MCCNLHLLKLWKKGKGKNEGTYIYLDRIVESLLYPFLSDRFYISVWQGDECVCISYTVDEKCVCVCTQKIKKNSCNCAFIMKAQIKRIFKTKFQVKFSRFMIN